jgi:hypothetical protein
MFRLQFQYPTHVQEEEEEEEEERRQHLPV